MGVVRGDILLAASFRNCSKEHTGGLLMDACILLSISSILWSAQTVLLAMMLPFYPLLKENWEYTVGEEIHRNQGICSCSAYLRDLGEICLRVGS